MNQIRAAEAHTTIHADAKRVWQTLTSQKDWKKFFLGANVETDWHVGSPIVFRGEFKGKTYEDKGEVRSVVPNEKLAFTHFSAMSGDEDKEENYHLVAITLAPKGGDTAVTLTQDNQNGKPVGEKARSEFEKNWSTVLEGLRKLVETT